MKKLIAFFSVIFLFHCPSLYAAVSPLAVGIVNPVQFPPDDYDVMGARVSLLWGKHRAFTGVDIGLIGNFSTQRYIGAAVSGVFNKTENVTTITGFQLAGITNINKQKTSVYGVQAALGWNNNSAESKVVGLQLASANLSSHTTVYGAQVGIYNEAREVYGLQIGLINRTQNLHGLQIGLLNFHQQGFFVVSPILNIGF